MDMSKPLKRTAPFLFTCARISSFRSAKYASPFPFAAASALIGWLVGWLVGWLIGWLVLFLGGGLIVSGYPGLVV